MPEGQSECLWENPENYKTFSGSIEKELTKKDKDGNGSVAAISWKINLLVVQDL